MNETKKYQGSCHCGLVSYEVETDLEQLVSCNCSICSKKGYLLTFVPEKAFRLVSGQNEQTDYLFYKKHIHHLFCENCGVASFARGTLPDGSTIYAINVRCLEGVKLEELSITSVDGKSL